MWTRVLPDWEDQVLDPEAPSDDKQKTEYSGVFRFRFWRFGKWVEVLVEILFPDLLNLFPAILYPVYGYI